MPKFSPDQLEFIRENYLKLGGPKCAEVLGGCRPATVSRAANAMGIYKSPPWTYQDKSRLEFLWGVKSLKEIAAELGRTETAVYYMAHTLGLGRGCPRGFMYLTELSRRSGFDIATVRKILRWAGVTHKRVFTPSTRAVKNGRTYWVVEEEKGVTAIEEWMKEESVTTAAISRGIHPRTLLGWLAEDGYRRSVPNKRWRLPSATIDAVISKRRN